MTRLLQIPIFNRKGDVVAFAQIDAADAHLVEPFRWHGLRKPDGRIYARRVDVSGGGRDNWLMHRVILGLKAGDPDQGDHINGDTLDNRRSNLRVVTQAQNAQNRRVSSRSASGLRGVLVHKNRRIAKWEARVTTGGKERSLGYFKDPSEAAKAASDARRVLMTHSVEERHANV